MILVETAQRHGPLGSLQLTLRVVVFPKHDVAAAGKAIKVAQRSPTRL